MDAKTRAYLEGIGLNKDSDDDAARAFLETMKGPQRAEADRLVQEAEQRLERLIENDTRDARVLSGRRHSVATALRMTHSTGEAMSAYRTAPSAVGRLDLVSEGDR